jgi:predicted lipase
MKSKIELAAFAKLAYECSSTSNLLEVGNAKCLILSDESDRIIAIAGTNDFEDFFSNLACCGIFSRNIGKVHKGFCEEADKLYPLIKEKLRHQQFSGNITLTGHSLGGAIALILAARLQEDFSCTVVSFGSPRTGFQSFVERLTFSHHRYVLRGDPIQYFPPAIFGYVHYGKSLKLSSRSSSQARTDIHSMEAYCAALETPVSVRKMSITSNAA